MALNNKKFEDPDTDNGDTVVDDSPEAQAAAARQKAQDRLAAGAQKHATEKPAEETSKSTAVAVKAGSQVAARQPMINPIEPLKNAFPVEFDTLRGLKITSGSVVDIATGKPLGDTVGLELLSYQDQWVISPGVEGDDAKEFVRYSDDGKVTTKGEDCAEYLERLKSSDFPEAKMSKRTVIAGSLFDIGDKGRKTMGDLQDSLVQISLAPTSKASFDRYTMDQAFKISKGLIQPAGAERLKIECTPASKGGKDWTVANFSRYDAPSA